MTDAYLYIMVAIFMILTQKYLADSGCGYPDCHHDHTILYFHGKCHPHAAVEVAYDKRTGTLTVRCAKCKGYVAEVEVAK